MSWVSASYKKDTSAFKCQVGLVWLGLLGLFGVFVGHFDLDFLVIREKLEPLLGLELNAEEQLQGVPLTVLVSIGAMALAVLFGLAAALGKLSSNPLAFGLATFYNSFFRGTPLLVQLLLIYLGLPQLGPIPDAIPAGIAALALCNGAYLSEIFRASLLAVDPGQWEAAEALGMGRLATFWHVILPQATKIALAPTWGMFISLLKDSSLISVMGLWEVMFLAQSYGRSSYRYIEFLLTAAVIYWVLSVVLELIQVVLERRFK
ncbi:amino acid ABC transporter permease [Zoogloea sp.]|uniref:amino acid ABC transporter permease n=2 Tax=Zoogloea sp. TaxID=49181 RepID=UPI0035AEB1F8